MEDPITFDLWGKAIPDRQADAVELLPRVRPEVPRISILKELVASRSRNGWMLVADNLAWNTVEAHRVEIGDLFTDVAVYQSGYGPADLPRLQACAVHKVAYAGCLGCHVCGQRALVSGT
jgi:hypothetical protein